MQGIDATFGDVSFGRDQNPGPVTRPIIPAAIALALAGSVAVYAWVLHTRTAPAPDFGNAPSARSVAASIAAPATGAAAKPFGEIVIDWRMLAEMKLTSPAGNLSPLASLDAVPSPSAAPFPLPSLDAFPAEPAAGVAPAETAPLPPRHDVPEISESAPLPPPRPPEFAMPGAPERRLAQPSVATVGPTAPADNRNFFQKLFGLGLPRRPLRRPSIGARRTFGARCRIPSRLRVGSSSPARRRKVAARAGRCSAFRRHSARPPRARDTTDIRLSMTSPRAPSICPTGQSWKPTRDWAIGWTTPVT